MISSCTHRARRWVVLGLPFTIGLAACSSTPSSTAPTAAVGTTAAPITAVAATTAVFSTAAPTSAVPKPLPPAPAGVPVQNATLTPGAVFPGVTAAQVCVPGYASSVRAVSSTTKIAVFAEYHTLDIPGAYEVDHLISLELGGSNDITNLWPEPYAPALTGAHAKDKVENSLHADVCAGHITLLQAQAKIAADWWNVSSFSSSTPDASVTAPTVAPPAAASTTATATATNATAIICTDGYVWPSTTRQGACHGHGGIRK
jgi:hypothetical protein